MNVEISVGAVAWYGAIVSTLGVSVSILNAWRDRARLEISAFPNMVTVDASGERSKGLFVRLTAANSGRRPITVVSIALKVGRNVVIANDSNLHPAMLAEGTSKSWLLDQTGLNLA